MIFITNPLALPLLILIWSLDAWLWLVAIRLIIDKVPSNKLVHIRQGLRQFTDPLLNVTGEWMSYLAKRPIPTWLMWILTILMAMIFRHVLLVMVMALKSN